jgi:ribosome-binding protein aMBF1 (putative translation factor)
MHERQVRVVEDEQLPHLNAWRRHQALSRRELAARAELDPTTIKRIEDLATPARPRTVRALADGLGITPADLRRSPT